MLKNSNPLIPAVSRDPTSTAFFWDRHAPLPLTLVKLQASHFLNQKGIKGVLCKIAIDLSFVMNVFVYFYSFFKLASRTMALWNNNQHFPPSSSAIEVAKVRS